MSFASAESEHLNSSQNTNTEQSDWTILFQDHFDWCWKRRLLLQYFNWLHVHSINCKRPWHRSSSKASWHRLCHCRVALGQVCTAVRPFHNGAVLSGGVPLHTLKIRQLHNIPFSVISGKHSTQVLYPGAALSHSTFPSSPPLLLFRRSHLHRDRDAADYLCSVN